MISLKKFKYIYVTVTLLGIIFFPNNVFAAGESLRSEADPASYGSYCQNYLNISITASDYKRNTTMSTNNVEARTITMNCKGRCKYYIYYANYGDLEKLSASDKTDDLDEDIDDLVKVKKKTFTDSTTWSLPAGKEALVVVISLNNKKCEKKDNNGNCTEYSYPKKVAKQKVCDAKGNCSWENVQYDVCVEKDSSGKCTKTEKKNVKCPKGRFNTDDNPTSTDEVELKGNGASLFVQNPDETGLVPNLRFKDNPDYGAACMNAYNGIYEGDNVYANKAFTITNETDLEEYRAKYYNKVLAYCNQSSFAFNLTANQIKGLSKRLLRVYYYRKQFNPESFKDLSYVNNQINSLKQTIELNYGEDNIIDDTSNLEKSLTCDSKSSTAKSEEYLYVTEEKSVIANLSTGDIPICKSKCYEHLTVKYDPPAVVKAGLCFQYKVTVKSVSECGVEDNFDLDKITIPTTCSPTPICSNDSSSTQAGPNEDFDSCVKECDGGKYTQKCINSCYNQVYSKKNSGTKKTADSFDYDYEVSNNLLTLTNNNNNNKTNFELKRLTNNSEYSEAELTGYYNENNNKNCNTEKIIKYVHNNNNTKLQECAEYFFQAKVLFPYGQYNSNGTAWNKNTNYISNAGATEKATTNIPMQVGRASPFYFRSVSESLNTLKSLVLPANPTGLYKKYNISAQGVKRQYSNRYVCNQTCSFVGCNGTEALSAKVYVETIRADLEELADKIQKCTASASCDTEEKTTTFSIGINSNKSSIDKPLTGQTELNSTIGKGGIDGDGDSSNDMFVPETYSATKPVTGTGILGLCYNKISTPHYQTTISYPGTSIELKHGTRVYDYMSDNNYRYKKGYFCTSYDEENVNEEYWNWAINNNYASNSYPNNFTPTYNINAKLGGKDKGFGKYNWKINLDCFYSLYNNGECIPGDPECPNGEVEDECEDENSTMLCNTKFRVVTPTNLFPDDKGNKTTDESQIPFNWTKAAKDETITESVNASTGYGIDPGLYREQVEQESQNPSLYTNPSESDYRVYLNKENIQAIKTYVQANGYTSYPGTYTKVEGVEGLYYYRTTLRDNDNLVKDFSNNAQPGVNN